MSEAPLTSRRWFSFSLRSLLILVTLAAIGLGWVAYERNQSQREMQIAEQIKATGATVEFSGRFDPSYPWVEGSWWRRALSPLCGRRIHFLHGAGNRPLNDLSLLAG